MHPVGERAVLGTVILVVLVYVLGVLALVPGEDRPGRRAVVLVGKVVFHMALGADQRPHFVAGDRVHIPAGTLQPVLERLGIETQFHGPRIMAGRTADGVIPRVELRAELVDVLGPEAVAVLLDPFHHLGRLAVPAGGGQTALFRIAVDAVDVQKILYRVGVAAGFIVLVHEGVAEPQVFQVRLRVLEALGQRVRDVVFMIGHGTLVFGHDRGLVVLFERSVLLGKNRLEGRAAQLVGGESGLVFGGAQFRVHIRAPGQQRRARQGRVHKTDAEHPLIHRLPSLY